MREKHCQLEEFINFAPRAILSASFIGNPFLYSYQHLSSMKQLAFVTLVPTAMKKVLAAE